MTPPVQLAVVLPTDFTEQTLNSYEVQCAFYGLCFSCQISTLTQPADSPQMFSVHFQLTFVRETWEKLLPGGIHVLLHHLVKKFFCICCFPVFVTICSLMARVGPFPVPLIWVSLL